MPDQLPRRPLGSTGLQVSVLGLGCAPLNRISDASGIKAVHRALELGINYFDTAPGYGPSQDILGPALEGRSEPHLVATKLGHLANIADYRDPDAIEAQIAENLRRSCVDVLQVHEADQRCWWLDEGDSQTVQEPDEGADFDSAPVLRVMREARRRGQCRFLGITGNHAGPLARVLTHIEVDSMLLAYNYDLIRRHGAQQAVPATAKRGTAVILAGILHSGAFTRIDSPQFEPPPGLNDTEQLERFRALADLSRQCGLDVIELTIRFLLADPRISTVLLGAAEPREVDHAVQSVLTGQLEPSLHAAVAKLGA